MGLNVLRKAGVAAATLAAVGGVSLGASAFAATSVSAPHQAAGAASVATRTVSQVIAKGVTDGHAWSVVSEFHPTLTPGYVMPHGVGKGAQPSAGKSSLLCQHMVIDGVRVDQQGGPWSDCVQVRGAHDMSRADEAGLWGLHDKGISGVRLFVANPRPGVASGAVHLSNGATLTARTVTVPGTSYRAWAVAIPNGACITAVDTFDAQHRLLSHDTSWR